MVNADTNKLTHANWNMVVLGCCKAALSDALECYLLEVHRSHAVQSAHDARSVRVHPHAPRRRPWLHAQDRVRSPQADACAHAKRK